MSARNNQDSEEKACAMRVRLPFLLLTCLLIGLQVLVSLGQESTAMKFTDWSDRVGIDFVHTDGSSGQHYIVETVVAGLAMFDYNNDGWIDIYFLNGAPLKGTTFEKRPTNALYRNNGDFTFTDVTDAAGVGDAGYGLGVVAADYDQDGDDDLYISNFGENIFYINNGDGTFTDATSVSQLKMTPKFGAGCSFVDIDGDGDLDLYASSYVQFRFDQHKIRMIGKHQFHPGPTDYPPSPDTLFRNLGNGMFEDISLTSGIAAEATSSMGVLAFDADDDGDSDIFVANDQLPNSLWINDGRGNFVNQGISAGVAFDRTGKSNGNMGIEYGDLDGDGYLDLFTTTYQDEMPVLYKNLGGGVFMDATNIARIDNRLFPHVNWGCGLVDFDNDMDLDIFIACGHFMDNIQYIDDRTSVKMKNYLLQNDGRGRFTNVTDVAGDGLAIIESSRGAAFGDLDNDGDVDAVILNANTRPSILRNESNRKNKSLSVELVGRTSNRSAVGAQVKLQLGERLLSQVVIAGRGYQSHYGTRIHFGLGQLEADDVPQVEVRWPGGITEVFSLRGLGFVKKLVENSSTNWQP